MMKQWNVISLGAGVQSSTMALMAAKGAITPMPDAAIFADTQGEPASVYRWLDWLEQQLPFTVHRVAAGSLAAKTLEMRTTKDGRLYSQTNIPVFTLSPTGAKGKIPFRSCTAHFKLRPLLKRLKQICGVKKRNPTNDNDLIPNVTSWIGISVDELQRMKPSRNWWVKNRWPLVEMRFTRQRCHEWMRDNGFPEPPRSACVFCPFHNNAEWRRLKNDEPEEFAKAVQFEKDLTAARSKSTNFSATPFLHRSCVPLDTIDFSSEEDNGQLNLWNDECEGMCGN